MVRLCEDLQGKLNFVKDVVIGVGECDGQKESVSLADHNPHAPSQAVGSFCKGAYSFGVWANFKGQGVHVVATEAITPEVRQCHCPGSIDDLQAHTAAHIDVLHQALYTLTLWFGLTVVIARLVVFLLLFWWHLLYSVF